jgi:regulator of protease activity HflC (stomatin/prohibitin superfamily)
MKLYFVLLCLCFSILSGCSSVEPNAGEEAVLVMKPMFLGHGGVDPTPVKTGLTYVAWTTDAIMVNMLPQQFEGNFNDMMSSDGVPLDFHGIIRVQVTNSVEMIKRFGPDWYKSNLEMEFFNAIRQAVRKHGMNETAIGTEAIEEIDAEVELVVRNYIQKTKLPVKLLKVTVGKANPPDSVKNQRIATAAEQQRVITESQRKLAEDARKEAEVSRAAADNAYREAMSLNPEQFLRLEEIKMQRSVCSNKEAGCSFYIGVSGTPVVNLN